ncbi:MAG: hypothetical protein GY847_28895 [Proteobacteria bacterium]|nr:hypothetical protein [Pseudomonadota bacterium]
MIGYAIGNGLSRAGFDLTRLNGKGLTVGCNYIYRDYTPDYVVSLDSVICAYIRNCLPDRKWKWLTREYTMGSYYLTVDGKTVCRLSDVNGGAYNNSGILACAYLAQMRQVETLYMIGFDFLRRVPGSGTNNIYEGNTGQSKSFMSNWQRLVNLCPDTDFVRVGPIPDYDKEFYNDTEKRGFTLMQFEDVKW